MPRSRSASRCRLTRCCICCCRSFPRPRRHTGRGACFGERPGSRARDQEFADSLLEETVSSEPVSGAQFPGYTGKYRELRQIRGSATDQMVQIGRKTRGLQRSSLCRLTGNFLRPNRDLNRAIRVIFGLIRELGAGAPAPDLAGASAKKRTAHVFPKGPDEFTRAAQLALGS